MKPSLKDRLVEVLTSSTNPPLPPRRVTPFSDVAVTESSPLFGQSIPLFRTSGTWITALFFCLSPLAATAQSRTITTVTHYRSGSGFFVNLQGQVVTNAHVLDKNCTAIEVRAQGQIYPAIIVAFDEARDLAVVQASTYPGSTPLALRDPGSPPRPGENALALGFPGEYAQRGELKISPSKIKEAEAKLNGMNDTYVTFTRSVEQGSSGGPLVDESGNVMGVVRGTGHMRTYNPANNQTLSADDMDIAIGGASLRAFLDQNRISYQTRYTNTRWDADLIRVRLLASVPNVRCVLPAGAH